MASQLSPTTIFIAREVVTMNGFRPTVGAVAVRDGRILCAGSLEECQSWGPATIDRQFEDHVLFPGMIEAHGHVIEGAFAPLIHVGYADRPRPDGTVDPGRTNFADIIDALRQADAALALGEPLIAVGFDPIFFSPDDRLNRGHLDLVSTTRPIALMHASGHLATVNTVVIENNAIAENTTAPGIVRDGAGYPTGELQEFQAIGLARELFTKLIEVISDPASLLAYARLCRNAGVTMGSDLSGQFIANSGLSDQWLAATSAEGFPARLATYSLAGMPGADGGFREAAALAQDLERCSTPMLRFGGVKLIADGSLQGGTGCCQWPGYYKITDHGQAQMTDEAITAAVIEFHGAHVQVYCHTNGSAATESFVNAVDAATSAHTWLDHRHTAQHVQTATTAQFRRMARLAMPVNIFTNHIWYWGDQHHDLIMGPEQAHRMWKVKTATDLSMSVSYHSDSGVTPTSQLHTAWCAVNRVTRSGRVLGESERVSVDQAMKAVTLEAAYQLRLDHEVGSIEAGKRADFAVLEQNPLSVEPMALRDIGVWGTVIGGVASAAGI